MGVFWGIANISNIFGVLEIPFFFIFIFFLGGGVGDAGSEPTYEEKMRVPPPPRLSHDNRQIVQIRGRS